MSESNKFSAYNDDYELNNLGQLINTFAGAAQGQTKSDTGEAKDHSTNSFSSSSESRDKNTNLPSESILGAMQVDSQRQTPLPQEHELDLFQSFDDFFTEGNNNSALFGNQDGNDNDSWMKGGPSNMLLNFENTIFDYDKMSPTLSVDVTVDPSDDQSRRRRRSATSKYSLNMNKSSSNQGNQAKNKHKDIKIPQSTNKSRVSLNKTKGKTLFNKTTGKVSSKVSSAVVENTKKKNEKQKFLLSSLDKQQANPTIKKETVSPKTKSTSAKEKFVKDTATSATISTISANTTTDSEKSFLENSKQFSSDAITKTIKTRRNSSLSSKAAKERRRERNKVLARKTRVKKKVELEVLRKTVLILLSENKDLKSIVKTYVSANKAVELLNTCANQLPDNVISMVQSVISRQENAIIDELKSQKRSFCIVNNLVDDKPIVYASAEFSKLTGYESHEIIGRNCRMLQGPKTNKAEVAKLSTALKEGKDYICVLINYRKDGAYFWNQVQVAHLRDIDGVSSLIIGIQSQVSPVYDSATNKPISMNMLESEKKIPANDFTKTNTVEKEKQESVSETNTDKIKC